MRPEGRKWSSLRLGDVSLAAIVEPDQAQNRKTLRAPPFCLMRRFGNRGMGAGMVSDPVFPHLLRVLAPMDSRSQE